VFWACPLSSTSRGNRKCIRPNCFRRRSCGQMHSNSHKRPPALCLLTWCVIFMGSTLARRDLNCVGWSPKFGLKTKKHTKHNVLSLFLISNMHSPQLEWSCLAAIRAEMKAAVLCMFFTSSPVAFIICKLRELILSFRLKDLKYVYLPIDPPLSGQKWLKVDKRDGLKTLGVNGYMSPLSTPIDLNTS